ncbi:MAG TPA: RagB/SusD family nutrient uptake outer membrane protein [Puia sp.]|nr:RagB/SusD family nutrient uptake outer membrane protein [Puia sp.]
MKKINHIICLALGLTALTACNKQLNTAPTNAVPGDLLFENVTNLSTLLQGTWSSMMDDFYGDVYSNPGYKTIGLVSDAMGDDVAVIPTKYGFKTTYTFTQMYDKTQSRNTAFWGELYKIINNMNIIIAHVDQVEGDSVAKAVLKGQALALRANTYLQLASFYQFSYQKDPQAKAVPIYTLPTSDTTVGHPRATLQQVYQLIVADLQQAVTLLQGYDRPAKWLIDQNVAKGLLARAYLNTGQWTLAAQAAVAARQGYTLMNPAEYKSGFNNIDNEEWIWGHPEIPTQNGGSYSFNFLDVTYNQGYYSYMADPHFMELFADGDVRKSLFYWDGDPGLEGYLAYGKIRFGSIPNQTGDLVLMRASEAYLIEAEGDARANDLDDAVIALNALRAARTAPAYDPTGQTQQNLIDTILVERRKELWGEGFSLSDIIRLQQPVVRKPYTDGAGNPIQVTVTTPDGTTKTVPAKYHTALRFPDGTPFVANSPYYLFAIPQSEEQNNPNLYK